MYFVLTEAVKRRFVLELRAYWATHPKYRDRLPKNIQQKYSFRERPQEGIVIKNSSGTHTSLTWDNFQGTVHSYVTAARVDKAPGLALEWVREDGRAIRQNGGLFPTAPGVYFLEIDSVAPDMASFTFFIDPLLDVYDEGPIKLNDSLYQVQAQKYLDGTLQVWQMPGSIQLVEGVNFATGTADDQGVVRDGTFTLLTPIGTDDFLSVDYRWPAETPEESPAILPNGEPWNGRPNRGLVQPLPGVVLAFGRRIEKGDKMAVIVSRTRDASALEFGGRWDITLDIDVTARDPMTQQELYDQTAMFIYGVLRSRLSTEGMEILNLSLGGESEEIYDEVGGDYFYNASLSVTLQTDWSLHVPLTVFIQRVQATSTAQDAVYAGMSDEEVAQIQNNLVPVANIQALQNSPLDVERLGLGLRSFRDPVFKARSRSFETIK